MSHQTTASPYRPAGVNPAAPWRINELSVLPLSPFKVAFSEDSRAMNSW